MEKKEKNRYLTNELVTSINENVDKNVSEIVKNCNELHDCYKKTSGDMQKVANHLK